VTVPEEGERISSRIDKFVVERYSEPQMHINKNPIVKTMNQSKFYLTGIIAIVGLLAFLLGAMIQSNNSGKSQVPGPAVTQSNVLPTNTNQKNGSTDRIQKSILGSDAVLAVVLFNSEEDYNKAKLNERGTVFEKISPYSKENAPKFEKQFNLFLIDSASNVLYRSNNISLPGTAN